MIYKEEIQPYRRTSDRSGDKEVNKLNIFTMRHVLLYISIFFAARVFMLNNMMPFGIAFFVAVYGMLEYNVAFAAGIFGILGYFSSLEGYISLSHALTLLILILSIYLFDRRNKNRIFKMSILAFTANTLSMFICKLLTEGLVLYNVILILFESTIIIASSYIFTYGMPLYFQNKKRKILSKEELICLGLMISIAISGMPDIKYFGFSARNMVAFFLVLVTGYIEGPAMGAASGVIIGALTSISDAAMPVSLGIYAFAGLICGLFKDMGKYIASIAFAVSVAIITFYTSKLLNNNTIFMDTLIPAFIFILIPQRKYEKYTMLLDGDKKEIQLQKSYVERVKDIINTKMDVISNTLTGLSGILEENINNELNKKLEIDGMVEKLADIVCLKCEVRETCWKRELYYTYDSFIELLRIIERTGRIGVSDIPESLRKKCMRPNELVKQANHVYEIFRINNKWRKKLINSRIIVSEQIKGISELTKSMMDEVAATMEFKNSIEEEIAVALDRKGLEFDDILAIKNSRNKYEIIVYKKPCSGQQVCNKDFISVISRALGVKMIRDKNNCKINKDSSMCQFRLVEAENYNTVTAVAKVSKEDVSGDNYTYDNFGEGKYMLALSDGMGSGIRASIESNTTISLLEKFMEAGFERNAAIKAINSVLVLRSCSESFATIDLGIIDLYSGIGEFIKIGAAQTFIKSDMEVEVIEGSSLPAGILDEIDIESQIVEFKNGDMIIMVTDGVIDANPELKEKWIIRAIKEFDSGNPKDIADYILNKAKEYYGNKIRDDMTVIVTKIWKVI